MKYLIYQFWDGNVRPSVHAGVNSMKAYADMVGADYVFEDNPQWVKSLGMNFGNYSAHYGAFKPLWNKRYRDYDKILFCDTDIFHVDGTRDNIFEEFQGQVGLCEEVWQPKQRTITKGRITSQQDLLWADAVKETYGVDVPRTEDGLVRIYNSGVVIYSQEGAEHARTKWDNFKNYVNEMRKRPLDSFYHCDQPYLHAMIFATDMDVHFMDSKWNSFIHGTRDINHADRYIVDHRTPETVFVHGMFPGADDMNEEQLLRIINNPPTDWQYDRFNVVNNEGKDLVSRTI